MSFRPVLLFFGTFSGVLISVDPYRDPYGSGEGKGLKSSGEEGTYFFGCILLHRWGDVAIGVQGEACGVMAEET